MTFIDKLRKASADNRSLLCVGLDFDPEKTPPPFRDDPAAYNKLIIDATQDLVCAYKPNAAFYEGLGRKGLDALSATLSYIPSHIPVILDAKRGDIGNTSAQYARAVFEEMGADAVTVSPYMGEDSVSPFLQFAGKGVFVLCLTSNPGSKDFQRLKCGNEYIYLHVARKCVEWAARYPADLGLVVGATQEEIAEIRSLCLLPFLVPGVGSQGGDLGRAVREGNRNGALAVINASRSIIYPSGSGETGDRIRAAAEKMRKEIEETRTAGGKQ